MSEELNVAKNHPATYKLNGMHRYFQCKKQMASQQPHGLLEWAEIVMHEY